MKGFEKMSLGSYSHQTLLIWTEYAQELRGVPVTIQIYEDDEEWKKVKKGSFKENYKEYENGICQENESSFSILLFCDHYQYQEEVFNTYLHEIGHAYLHFPRDGKHSLELEIEVHDWININFWKELNKLYKATAYLKGRPRKYNYAKKPTKKVITEAEGKYPDHFFISEVQKNLINQWIDNIVEMAKAFKQANDKIKRKN